jgi:hypothetical protein
MDRVRIFFDFWRQRAETVDQAANETLSFVGPGVEKSNVEKIGRNGNAGYAAIIWPLKPTSDIDLLLRE